MADFCFLRSGNFPERFSKGRIEEQWIVAEAAGAAPFAGDLAFDGATIRVNQFAILYERDDADVPRGAI